VCNVHCSISSFVDRMRKQYTDTNSSQFMHFSGSFFFGLPAPWLGNRVQCHLTLVHTTLPPFVRSRPRHGCDNNIKVKHTLARASIGFALGALRGHANQASAYKVEVRPSCDLQPLCTSCIKAQACKKKKMRFKNPTGGLRRNSAP
jgi:hypothetical protein